MSIKNFQELSTQIEAVDYDFEAIEFTEEDLQSLRDAVFEFTEENLAEAKRVLAKWYGLNIPDSLLKEVLAQDIELAHEAYTGGISDTGQREILIDAVLKQMGLPNWPANYQAEAYFQDFAKQLQAKAPIFDILFV